MLTIEDLAFERDSQYLFQDLNFVLLPGEGRQIVGPNGCGKSTFLRLIAGLLSPTSGAILWTGQSTRTYRDNFLKQLLYIGHRPALYADLTVEENLQWLQEMSGNRQISYQETLQELALVDVKNIPARHLSAGQRQRLTLAKLCFTKASLWLLDEPWAALDKFNQCWLSEKIRQHLQQAGLILLTSHQAISELSLDAFSW